MSHPHHWFLPSPGNPQIKRVNMGGQQFSQWNQLASQIPPSFLMLVSVNLNILQAEVEDA